MKRKAFLFSIIIFSFFCFGFVNAQNYYYDKIEVEIRINKDSTFDVSEKQTYSLDGSFGYFYRDIELKRLDHISDVEVSDSQGNKLDKKAYDLKHKGNKLHIQWNFVRRDFENELKSWTVKYRVHGGLGFYKDYDELYWNVIFQDREVVVKKAEVFVYLPEKADQIKARLFAGKEGSQQESLNYQIIDEKTIKFWEEDIYPGEFLTIVAVFPKGIVEKPLFYRNQLIGLIVLLIAFLLPFLVFLRSFLIWRRRGKDPKIKKTIIAVYSSPLGLAPALVGVLIKQKVGIKEILATVVDLAVRGYLRIKEEEKKILFIKSKEYIFEKIKQDNNLVFFEEKTMKALFEKGDIVSTKDLQNKFYKKIPGIKKEIYREVEKTNLFEENIQKTRKKYKRFYSSPGNTIKKIRKNYRKLYFFAFLLFSLLLGVFVGAGFLNFERRFLIYIVILFLSLLACFLINSVFAYFMPRLTKQGLEAKWKALGFKHYLSVAERFRIGVEKVETFSKLLPFAMVFGVERKWAERFSDFSYKQQGWYYPAAVYSGKGGLPASFSDFGSSFSSFSNSISSAFSPPGSSGAGAGGAAGGGGGGGGGGAG